MTRQLIADTRRVLWALALAMPCLGLLAVARPARAQALPELWLMARGDSVLIQVSSPPTTNHGFMVYRAESGGEFELVTPEPILPARTPSEALAALGEAREDVMADLRVADPVTLFRRLRTDRLTATVMSLSYREVSELLGRFYADSGLQEGATYEYRVVFVDQWGEETEETRSGRVQVVEVEPGVPVDLVAEAGNGEVTISWTYPRFTGNPTDFVSGFHIYRAAADTEVYERVTRGTVYRSDAAPMWWRDEEAENDVVYRYRVRAVDMAGREGPFSAEVSAAPIDDSRPMMPTNLVTEASNEGVSLAWRISPESNVAGYRVERSTGLDQPFEQIVEELIPAEDPTHFDPTVRGSTQYFYRIIAVNQRGLESEPSNPIGVVAIDETPPEPAAALEASALERQVRIWWGHSPSDDVQGYHVFRGETSEHLVRLTEEPITATEYLDSGFEGVGLTPGWRYFFRVIAVDHSGNESEPVEAMVEIPDDVAPDPATGLLADNLHGRYVEIHWSSSPSLDVSHYELRRSTLGGAASGGEIEIGLIPVMDRYMVEDTTVVRGERYRYTLIAVDSAGNRSEPATVELHFRDITAPPAPRHAVAQVTEAGVQVSWERVVARNLIGYRVYRATIPTGTYEPVSEVIDDPRVFTDPGGQEGHFYTVRAIDSSGNESRPSPAARAERL